MKCDESKLKKTNLIETDRELAKLCKALGHEARIMILRVLIERNACVCGEIVDELPISQSTVSQHLKVLKECDLIQGEVQGPSICYCINPKLLNDYGF
ncbi:MAG: ArsR/SmtB family transcription factor [Nitrospiria bacterium]